MPTIAEHRDIEKGMTSTIARLVGRQVEGMADFDRFIREGFSFKAGERVKEALTLTDKELAVLLDISGKTLSRLRQAHKRYPISLSDRLFRLMQVFALAEEVLEDPDRARQWLHRPQMGLGGKVPLKMIETATGTKQVEDLLWRMEYGVLA